MLVLVLSGSLSLSAFAAETPEAQALRSLLSAEPGRMKDMQVPLARFYGGNQFEPVWFRGHGVKPEARQALDILKQAESHGLEEGDYGPGDLSARLSGAADARSRAEADLSLSLALFRFLSDLHVGRVRPHSLGLDLDMGVERPDLPVLVAGALAQGRLASLPDSLAPQFPMYAGLRQVLARYRDLARSPFELLPVVKKKLEPGQAYPALALLRDRLVRLGDLPPTSILPPRYEGDLVEGVKHFQARHGLEPDGVIGVASFAQLNVPMAARYRQIELGLERLRWLKVPPVDKVVGVNIPEFRLRAFDIRNGEVLTRFSMKVIVGQAVLEKKTPVFQEDMRTIDFKPFWNVPPTIARAELLPKLRKNPGYLAQQEMEIVPASGGKPSTELTPEALAAVAHGSLRIRQRPGAKNPLGPIKFVLPNNHDVYLHYTSTPRLFQKSRRDFSHGCIRLEEPVALARFVLEDQPDWTEERIRAAMAAEKPSSVHLLHPVPVVIFYTTVVEEPDGRVFFLSDIYGLDPKLDVALKSRSASRPSAW
ncbi:MAG: L,D-transpeptidase family protein [Rhodocyclaceae bacterium]|nr:L,D-transpeptidase family protein [Rhodocyclaceae bacterium]